MSYEFMKADFLKEKALRTGDILSQVMIAQSDRGQSGVTFIQNGEAMVDGIVSAILYDATVENREALAKAGYKIVNREHHSNHDGIPSITVTWNFRN